MYYYMIQKSRETDSPNFLVHNLILKGNKYGQKALVYTKLTEIYICCENSMTVIGVVPLVATLHYCCIASWSRIMQTIFPL